MTWWHWLLFGLVLIALEMAASGGFYVVFFGIAALAIAGLHMLDIAGPAWFQLLLFSLLSIASLLLFRRPVMHWLKLDSGPADVDTLVGEAGVALEDISAGALGRVELRGTTWAARNISQSMLDRGRRCVVIKTDRLTLFVKAEEAI